MSGLRLFEGFGIEIESMVVHQDSLDVRPVVDALLRDATGADEWVEDHDDGAIGWSNELVNHVVELKTNGPAPGLGGLAGEFQASARRANALLAPRSAQLMPTGMHPWMDPRKEAQLWPHDTGPVYRAYDQLFDCHRHGWANLQSVHLNLSFQGDEELAALLAAVRIVLPLVPALAASSPFVEGRATGLLDNRLEVYRTNAERTPGMTGDVIPEPIFGADEYRARILGAIDQELAALGADEVLRGQEWTNARGAIVRFDRMAIEVRLIDAQECAAADLAVAAAVSDLVRRLIEGGPSGTWASTQAQREVATAPLAELLVRAIANGPATPLEGLGYAELFGLGSARLATVGELLERVLRPGLDEGLGDAPELVAPLELILRDGTLSQRILAATGPKPTRAELRRVYAELCACQAEGQSFRP
ncbi:MAG: glutamate-cysteine ligase family protein [Planctomycetota bacterium]|nr:glutamate-cysteine ligase family protein [Planctomycetota bacterium]